MLMITLGAVGVLTALLLIVRKTPEQRAAKHWEGLTGSGRAWSLELMRMNNYDR